MLKHKHPLPCGATGNRRGGGLLQLPPVDHPFGLALVPLQGLFLDQFDLDLQAQFRCQPALDAVDDHALLLHLVEEDRLHHLDQHGDPVRVVLAVNDDLVVRLRALDLMHPSTEAEARRLAQGGGLRLNDEAISDGARLIESSDINTDGVLKLAAGKKKIVLVRPV